MNRFQKGIALVCALVLMVSLFVPALSLAEVTVASKASAPINVTASASQKMINLWWDEVPGASSYLIYRGTQPSVSTSTVYFTVPSWAIGTFKNVKAQQKNPLLQTKDRSYYFDDTKVTVGTPYFYKVVAVVDGVKSPKSLATGAVAYSAPPTAKFTKTSTGVKMVWSAVPRAAEYQVYRETAVLGGWDDLRFLKATTSRSYVDKSAVPGKTYSYLLASYYIKSGVFVDTGFFAASPYLVPKAITPIRR